MSMLSTLAVFSSVCLVAQADLYLHSFRGSNNRLDEANRDRANGNRLFDSQNNNRGGYNVGSVYYEAGSKAYFQWTAQHGCGNAGSEECEMVWQYMCDPQLRDGTTTNRIPTDQTDCDNDDCNTDLEYGMQENYDNYYKCQATTRNKGLFVAGQNLNGDDATHTRQNPNANRYGYECAEERDYYPYWRPTPWIDIAVMTNSPTRCAEYQAKSENVLGRWFCDVPGEMYAENKAAEVEAWIPIDETECNAISFVTATGELEFAVWTQAASKEQPAPQCIQNKYSRDNHLGSVEGGYMNSFNWTVPKIDQEQCAFRVRYNITTSEYAAWQDKTSVETGAISAENNAVQANADRDPAVGLVYEDYAMTLDEVEPSFNRDTNNNADDLRLSREYVLKNNPSVDAFGGLVGDGTVATQGYLKLQMNVNTAQFGRGFQDRSHRFAARAANPKCADTVTHNLQVRGKRGNIVQVYPSTEYDFVPDRLDVGVGECVHVQWTGSNTNPNNNDGQGRQGTDRTNIVQLASKTYEEDGQPGNTNGQFGRSFPSNVNDDSFMGLSYAQMKDLALNGANLGGELSELDDTGTYFDMAPFKVSMAGVFNYLCTRNNNFSNRSQKGKIVASSTATMTESIGWNGGSVEAATGAVITVAEGAFSTAVDVTMEILPKTDDQHANYGVRSDYAFVYMDTWAEFHLSLPYDSSYSINGHAMYFHPSHDANLEPKVGNGWQKLGNGIVFENSVATGTVSGAGIYVVTQGPVNWALAILIPLAVVGVFGGAGFMYFKHKAGAAPSSSTGGKKFVKTVQV